MADRPLDASTRLAAERTRLAQERTLMAWIRTCTSLIASGFTIYQIFQYLSTKEQLREPIVSPQVFGDYRLTTASCFVTHAISWRSN